MTSLRKKVYTCTAVKDALVQKFQRDYVNEVESIFRDIEEHGIEGEITTRIMSIETYTNSKDNNQISLGILCQADIANYIKRIKEFKKNFWPSF